MCNYNNQANASAIIRNLLNPPDPRGNYTNVNGVQWNQPQMHTWRSEVTSAAGMVRKQKRIRTAFTSAQMMMLESEYKKNRYLERTRRPQLAEELKLNERTIKIWFQNRRMKEKKDKAEGVDSTQQEMNDNSSVSSTHSVLLSEHEYEYQFSRPPSGSTGYTEQPNMYGYNQGYWHPGPAVPQPGPSCIYNQPVCNPVAQYHTHPSAPSGSGNQFNTGAVFNNINNIIYEPQFVPDELVRNLVPVPEQQAFSASMIEDIANALNINNLEPSWTMDA